MSTRERIAVILAYAGMCLIWGTTWLAIKIGLHSLPPMTGVGFRFVIAGFFLYGIAALRRQIPPVRDVPWTVVLVLAALLFGLNYILTYTAELRLDSGLVSVLFGTLPFFTFTLGHFILKERTTPVMWLGGLIAFCGVAVISISGQVRGSPLFALAAIGAAASSAYANVYAKQHAHHPPLVTLPPAMLIAGIAVGALGISVEHTDWAHAWVPSSIAALLYLAIFGSGIAFLMMMWVLQRLPAWVVGMSSLVFPVIAIVVGVVFGGEHFTVRELLGAALVITGIWIAISNKEKAGEMTPAEA